MSGERAVHPVAEPSRSDWAARITEAWRAGVESIIETGRRICAAKGELDHGDFGAMIETDLPFGSRTAERLMAVALDQKLVNATHASLLPPSWMTLYELSRLSDDVFQARLADGTIHPEMQRKDVAGENRKPGQAEEGNMPASNEAATAKAGEAVPRRSPWRHWLPLDEALEHLTGLPAPGDINIPPSKRDDLARRLDVASAWLEAFKQEWNHHAS